MPLPRSDDELRDLCDAVNDMARRLAAFQDELQLNERLRLLGQFSGGLAHQLRNAAAGAKLAAEPFLAKGAVWANSPKQVGEQTEVVFTSLPVPADVEQVALGPNGLVEGMGPDTAFYDMSTNSVATVRKIHAAFAEKNLYMLDAPVSGGPSGAASGRMAIWVGGD